MNNVSKILLGIGIILLSISLFLYIYYYMEDIYSSKMVNKTMNELTDEELGATHREKALNQIIKYLKEAK